MANRDILEHIIKTAEKEGHSEIYKKKSLKWYKNHIMTKYKTVNRSTVRSSSKTRNMINPMKGKMYAFLYAPKYKVKLPYYDRWPLIIPYRPSRLNYIYAYNLHYLHPKLRLKVLYKLSPKFKNMVDKDFVPFRDKIDMMSLGSKNLRNLKACARTYLKSNMIGQPMEFSAETWPTAMFLPIAQFMKTSNKEKIWSDTKKRRR
tara:strand:- start:1 stop:609 length:609 start_codon:yes stop_codon:yes gene_type:complete